MFFVGEDLQAVKQADGYTIRGIWIKDELMESKIRSAGIFSQCMNSHIVPKVSLPKITERRESLSLSLSLLAQAGHTTPTVVLTSTKMPAYTEHACPCCFCPESGWYRTKFWHCRRLALEGDTEIIQCHWMTMWRCVERHSWIQRVLASGKNTWIVALHTNTLLTSFYRFEN